MITYINDENFELEVLNAKGKVLVDFFATWCGPCKIQARILDALGPDFDSVKICKCDVDEAGSIADRYSIQTIPTIMVFKDGEVLNRVSGVMQESALKRLLEI